MEFNRHRFIYTAEEAKSLPPDQPYIAHVCYYDWTDGDHSTLMHCHEDLAEVLLILKGHGRYTVDLCCQEVSAGDVILCNGGALHDEMPQTDEPYQTLCVAIGNLALPGLPPYCLLDKQFNPLFHQPEQFDDLMQLFCQIDRYAAEQEEGYQTLCQYLMLAALELVKRMTRGRKDTLETQGDSIFRQIAKYIDQHYAEDLSIEQLEKQFYISPYHLSHMFRHKTGYSLKQYLLRRRIGEAQMRLVHSQDTIQTISESVGFEDASYFSRIFSKYIGMTPSEYRKYRLGAKKSDSE
jgi:AraC-like DNA-binding protein/mannose-6-phosphate isomerase-like protein (cupin superfamily)